MKRIAAIALTMALISGCAAPVPITVATLVMDGFSYATTEKSLTDHGISALADNDCAVHRVLNDEYMCRHLPKNTEVAEADQTSPPSYQSMQVDQTAHANPVSAGSTSRTNAPGVYAVLASSPDRNTAQVYSAQYKSLTPTMFAMPVGPQKISFHLLLGPVTRDEYEHARVQLQAHGIDNVWALKVDALDWSLSHELMNNVRPLQAAQVVN